jgi:hypothetical protein
MSRNESHFASGWTKPVLTAGGCSGESGRSGSYGSLGSARDEADRRQDGPARDDTSRSREETDGRLIWPVRAGGEWRDVWQRGAAAAAAGRGDGVRGRRASRRARPGIDGPLANSSNWWARARASVPTTTPTDPLTDGTRTLQPTLPPPSRNPPTPKTPSMNVFADDVRTLVRVLRILRKPACVWRLLARS